MKAVVRIQGRQFTAEVGKVYFVNQFKNSQTGDVVELKDILMTIDDSGATSIGRPLLADKCVKAKILENKRGEKVIICKKRRRKGYQRKRGHRQELSVIKIESIS
jgi:large subunit ribosomal protein L21